MASHLHVTGCEGCETLLECPRHRPLTEEEKRGEVDANREAWTTLMPVVPQWEGPLPNRRTGQ